MGVEREVKIYVKTFSKDVTILFYIFNQFNINLIVLYQKSTLHIEIDCGEVLIIPAGFLNRRSTQITRTCLPRTDDRFAQYRKCKLTCTIHIW